MSWQEIPFVRLTLPFIIGIIASIYIDAFINGLWLILTLLISLSIFFKNSKSYQNRFFFGIFINLFLFFLGYQICFQYNELRSPLHFSNFIKKEKTTLLVQLNEIPLNSKWVRAKTIVKSINQQPCDGNLLVYINRDSLSETLAYGDLIAINTYLNKVEPPKNPNQFDYQDYLHFNNIHYQTFVKAGSWELVEQEQGNIFYTAIFKLRKHSLNTLEKYLSPNSYPVGAALILGYREALSQDIRDAYGDTGAIHVLAVSGLHVGIVTLILNFLLNLIPIKTRRFKKIIQPTIIIASLWLFAFLTGASPSVLRAATMFSFVTIGFTINRPSSIYNTLAISAFLILLFKPYLIKSVGFQLSYLAVLGIVYFQPKLYRLFRVPTKLGDYSWQLTSIAIGAQLGTMPVTLFFFHRFPVMFWLSGLIVIPAATLILSLGILTLVLEWIFPFLASCTAWLLDYIIYGVNQSIFWIQSLPVNKIEGIWLPSFSMFLLYGAIISLVLIIQNRFVHQRQKRLRAFFAMLAIIFIMTSFTSINHIGQQKKQQVFVYNVYKHSIISFIDGHDLYRFQSDSIDKKSIAFSVDGHENALRIRQKTILNIGDSIQNNAIYSNGNIVYFKEKIFLIIDDNFDIEQIEQQINVDYVILTGNPKLYLKNLVPKVNCQQIIVDASNNAKKIGYWKKDAKELGVSIYNVADGAWRME